jgi:hypothetical protein
MDADNVSSLAKQILDMRTEDEHIAQNSALIASLYYHAMCSGSFVNILIDQFDQFID